jgi:hypothetical protein
MAARFSSPLQWEKRVNNIQLKRILGVVLGSGTSGSVIGSGLVGDVVMIILLE